MTSTRVRCLKEYSAPASATSGLAGYSLEGQKPGYRRWGGIREDLLGRLGVKVLTDGQLVAKGDVDGHEFHGNQWTEGSDGGQLLEVTTPSGKKAGIKVGSDGEVHSVFVPEADRGKGLGSKLYQAAHERMASKGKTLHSGQVNEASRKVWGSLERRGLAEPHGSGWRMKGSVMKLLKALTTDQAAHEAAASPFNLRRHPTEGQQRAGNYKKGTVKVAGRSIRIENPAGSQRRPEWPTLKSHYGYFPGTRGADGEGVDVFVRVGTPADYDGPAYAINQYQGGAYDEAKVMQGWRDWPSARAAYAENYTPDWQGLHSAVELTQAGLDDWLENGEPDRELDAVAASLITPLPRHAWVEGGKEPAQVVRKALLTRLAAGLTQEVA